MKMSGMKLVMMACCAVMAVPLIGYFAIGGSVASGGGALGAALPLLACVALHGAMFLFMGKSCHSDKKVADDVDPANVVYPTGAATTAISQIKSTAPKEHVTV
jgi:hypothetical protein